MTLEFLQQVRSIDPIAATDQIVDVLLEQGRLVAIAPQLSIPEGAKVIDGRGLVWGPGLVDLYSRSGEPGHEERETLSAIARAGLAGGFTQLHLLPKTQPALDHPAAIEWVHNRVAQLRSIESLPNIHCWGALTLNTAGQQMTELSELAPQVVGFGDGGAIASIALLRRILEYSQPIAKPLLLWLWNKDLAGTGTMRQGVQSLQFGLPGIGVMAETVPLSALLELLRDSSIPKPKVPIHLMRISNARSIELIAQAKAEGLPITASTTWLHLLLDSTDLASYDPNLRLAAPLGNPSDRQALIQAVKSGVIDAIAVDHIAYTYEEKTVAFGEAPAGAMGLEFAWAMLWNGLVETGQLSAIELWRSLSTQPLNCLGHGTPNQPIASSFLFDPNLIWTPQSASRLGQAQNTHLLDHAIQGRVIQAWC